MSLMLCLGALLVQGGYLAWLLSGTPTRAPKMPAGPAPPITAIVALRNERDRLPDLAAALRTQTHPDAAIVWVNDHSTDATASWLDAHAAPREHEQVVHHAGPPGKKHALHAGIQAASTALFAFTDADCSPPPTWLETLARMHGAQEQAGVVIGASVESTPHGGLQRLAGYETWTANTAMLAAAQQGAAYMAVGRNLSYAVSAYHATDGHPAHAYLLSGDDDLFVQAARNAGVSCQPCWHAEAHVPTRPPTDGRRWLRAQRRHTSTGRAYNTRPALHLSLYYASALVVYLSPLLVGTTGLGLLAIRALFLAPLLHRMQEIVGAPAPTLLFPLWDAAHVVLRIGVSAFGLLAPPHAWE